MGSFTLTNLTRRSSVPRFPYAAVAAEALPGWEVSLVFVSSAKAKALNSELRGKDYIPNVLSYEAGARHGEIIICLSEVKKQAPAYGIDEQHFTLYLFIHGLMHLKGRVHGATMEHSERTLMAKYATGDARSYPPHVTTHRNGHRHRHLPGEGRRRRGSR